MARHGSLHWLSSSRCTAFGGNCPPYKTRRAPPLRAFRGMIHPRPPFHCSSSCIPCTTIQERSLVVPIRGDLLFPAPSFLLISPSLPWGLSSSPDVPPRCPRQFPAFFLSFRVRAIFWNWKSSFVSSSLPLQSLSAYPFHCFSTSGFLSRPSLPSDLSKLGRGMWSPVKGEAASLSTDNSKKEIQSV